MIDEKSSCLVVILGKAAANTCVDFVLRIEVRRPLSYIYVELEFGAT